MKSSEYVLSLLGALLLLGGLTVWTQAEYRGDTARFACQRDRAAPAVTLKGLMVYPACAKGKRG